MYWNGNLFKVSSHWTRIILQDNSNVQVLLTLTSPDTIKPKQWPVQSHPTHCKCKGAKTGNKCAADIKQTVSGLGSSGSYKRNNIYGVCWWHWTDHYVVETYARTSKYAMTSLLKVICRSVWLCKLTYPVIYRLILNKSHLRQTSKVLNIT